MAEREETTDPKEERVRIGTPAGERPVIGRERHGTECLTDVCPMVSQPEPRRVLDRALDEELLEEEETITGELSTRGGITGTHAKGGRARGGTQSGGPEPERAQATVERHLETQPGAVE
jgi:hypothetical protein